MKTNYIIYHPSFFPGFFLTKIFHPNVSSRGEICVNTLKKDWKSDLGLKHVLLTIKCLLIVPNPESALNEEAGKLILESYDDYYKRAKLYTEIHAKSSQNNSSKPSTSSASSSNSAGAGNSNSSQDEASANKKACNVSLKKKSDKVAKDKKKTLKRLWGISNPQDQYFYVRINISWSTF